MEKKNTYSNLITKEMINRWKLSKGVILKGGTGTGKTYFIINTLASVCRENDKKILFLCNRAKLRDDVKDDIYAFGNEDIVTVTTYQALQQKIINGYEIEEYDYIAYDECHYILDDATFVDFTDEILKYAISRENSVGIFMSATAHYLFNKLNNIDLITDTYEIPVDYRYVDKLEFLYQKDGIENEIADLLNDTEDKIVYFANSAKEAYRLFELYKDNSYFYCSEGNRDYSKYSTYDCIKAYNKDLITFDKRLLITTTVLDNGINLIDRRIKHILTDVLDLNKMQQCLGRKRIIDEKDTCSFYIRKYSKGELGSFKGGIMTILNPATMYKKDRPKFRETYLKGDRRFTNEIVYLGEDERLNFNEVKYYKYKIDLMKIKQMEEKSHKYIILQQLGDSIDRNVICDAEYTTMEKNKIGLEMYLDSIVGKKLFKEERDELKEMFNRAGLKDRTMGVNTLKGKLLDLKLPFIIDVPDRKSYRDSDGKCKKEKTHWIIKKIVG